MGSTASGVSATSAAAAAVAAKQKPRTRSRSGGESSASPLLVARHVAMGSSDQETAGGTLVRSNSDSSLMINFNEAKGNLQLY